MTLLFSSVLHFFCCCCCWKYTELSIFLEKFIGQWIPVRDGRGIARDIVKIISIFKTWQKMVTKFWQFKELKCPNFVNCPNFVTIFCRVLKMKIIFCDIPSNSRPSRSGIHWQNQFFFKKIDDSVYFQRKEKVQNWREEKGPGTLIFSSGLNFLLLKIYRIVNFFGKNWLVNEFRTLIGGGLLGISQKIIFLFKTRQKMVTKLWQFTKLGHFSFLNCPNFVTIFCQLLKIKIFFWYS